MLGTRIADRYLVEAELGAGAMGRVYRARDQATGQAVALKVLLASIELDAGAVARLRREAALIATLNSPFVVRLLDAGTHAGNPFLVMEFVPGQTLASVLARRPRLQVGEALAITRHVALALDAAHAHGIVHRDLKPSNIMISAGAAKVLDFGLARADGDPTLTTTGAYLGTPTYSAPERVTERGDIRSDIYSTGVVLFRMLAGAPPFDAATPWAVLHAHRFLPPPPLPDQVPRPVQALVNRCLAKEPAGRYQTPADLLAALGAIARVVPEAPIAGLGDHTSVAYPRPAVAPLGRPVEPTETLERDTEA